MQRDIWTPWKPVLNYYRVVNILKLIKGGKDKSKSKEKTSQYDHDWEAIENDITTTAISIRAIGRKHNVSEGAIRKYIKKNGIERDLSLKVKAAVRRKLVRNPVRKKTQVRTEAKTKVRTKKTRVKKKPKTRVKKKS